MKKNPIRRGVLLLVVLALLAMFAMVAVAFVVLTGAEKRSPDRVRNIGVVDDSPDKTLQSAFNVVVRGTASIPIRKIPHSLRPPLPRSLGKACWKRVRLRDDRLLELAGHDGNNGNGTPLHGRVRRTVDRIHPAADASRPDDLRQRQHQRQRRSVPLRGLRGDHADRPGGRAEHAGLSGSTRRTFNVQMARLRGGVLPANGDQYIVNGFPYSGMGFGFNHRPAGSLTQMALAAERSADNLGRRRR